MSVSSASCATFGVVLIGLGPTESLTQLLAGGLDRVRLFLGAQSLELKSTIVLVLNEAAREGAVLNISQNVAHSLLGRFVDNARTRDVVAVLSGVRAGPTLLGDATFVDQVDDQLHLVADLEVGDLGLVASFDQGLETGLDQVGNPATQNSLLAEEVRFGLFGEGGLDDAGAGAADCLGVGQNEVPSLTGSVNLDGDDSGVPLPWV